MALHTQRSAVPRELVAPPVIDDPVDVESACSCDRSAAAGGTRHDRAHLLDDLPVEEVASTLGMSALDKRAASTFTVATPVWRCCREHDDAFPTDEQLRSSLGSRPTWTFHTSTQTIANTFVVRAR